MRDWHCWFESSLGRMTIEEVKLYRYIIDIPGDLSTEKRNELFDCLAEVAYAWEEEQSDRDWDISLSASYISEFYETKFLERMKEYRKAFVRQLRQFGKD